MVCFDPWNTSVSDTSSFECVPSIKVEKEFLCIPPLPEREHKNADFIRESGCQQESMFVLQ